jgi:hypothetical protein
MRLLSIIPKPNALFVDPTLEFELVFGFRRGQQVPLDFTLVVATADGRLMGTARPTLAPSTGATNDPLPLDASTLNTGEANWVVRASLPLTARQLDHIEDLRSKERKGDVVLNCDIEAASFASRATVAAVVPGPEAQDKAGKDSGQHFVFYLRNQSARDRFYSQYSDMWLLSGDSSRTFLQRETFRHPMKITISSGDWVHDYTAAWRATRYMVVELPQPSFVILTPEVEKRLAGAVSAVNKASQDMLKGEWNDVVEDLRPVWELLRNDVDIQQLLARDGYTPAAVAAFNESVRQQFELASKFLHKTDKAGNAAPEIRAAKEDAFLCYSFALSVVNLVSRKAERLAPRT